MNTTPSRPRIETTCPFCGHRVWAADVRRGHYTTLGRLPDGSVALVHQRCLDRELRALSRFPR